MSLNGRLEAKIHILEVELGKLKFPIREWVKRLQYKNDKKMLREYIERVESMISVKWYTHTGLIEKLKTYFNDRINQNHEDVRWIKEELKNVKKE